MNLLLEQQFDVHAPREAVWSFLMHGEEVGNCMPGVESVEKVGDQVYLVRVAVGIGPVQARMTGKVTTTEMVPPDYMRLRLDWKDITTNSTVTAPAEIHLSDTLDGGVTISVRGTLSVVGPLGKYGQPIANRKAAEITRSFAECVRGRLESPLEGDAAAVPARVRPAFLAAILLFVTRLRRRITGRSARSA
jgi:uncharacterized protein